ncbi:MAG: hypothetical protein IK144_01460 [Bacteroidaceae bacterium]|nr:hypothetical protein [Bacteroidaceae bacterium]
MLSFKGKFLGNGKTITVNLESTDLRVMAPFRFVDQALIQNLTIAGTIKYTEQDQEGACGGIVGVNYGYTTLNKCIFTGSLLKGDNTPPDDAATSYYGGFVGWNTRSITIRDCLFNPTEITVSDEHAATFYNNDYSTLPRAYYLTPFGKTQGCRVYAREEDVPADVTVFPETFFNGTTYYVESGLKVDNTIAADQPGHYYINMPTEGIEYYTIPAGIRHFKVYDDGGKDGKASEYCDADLVLTVPSGCLIQATGTVTTCDYRGKVALYDGDSYWDDEFDSWDSYPYYGEPEWVDPVVTTGESMDIYFRADYDADTDASNLDLVVSVIEMPLQDKANNDALIAANSGKLVNAALTGRKLYVDNDWNTICLPFSLSKEQIDASLLMGCVIKELDTDASNYEHPTGYHNGTLYLNFKDAETIEAGKPYLIKWSKHKVYNYGIPDPGFVDVTVTATTPAAITSSDGYVSFVGTYSPTDIFSADKTNLYVGSNNKLHYPWANNMQHFYLNACRGYFRLNKGLTAGDPSAVKEFRLNFGEDEPLSIINFQLSIGEADGWYDLNGRKLGGKPTKRGLYIHNGEKIAIK